MWKNGKKWVYSITYDEGFRLLLDHALPVHRRCGVPGHLALVASQIGVPRDVTGSTYNGMMILSVDEIAVLREEGWGVSCHGMNNVRITEGNLDEELAQSRERLAAALSYPVTMFCLPGDNGHFPIVHANAAAAGYHANLTLYDRINTIDSDLLSLGRVPLHTEYPPPFYSAYDPYKRIHQAIDHGGWIIDYCHCPMPGKALHPWKDCTLEELERRFSTVLEIGGSDVWLAEPNEVVEYIVEMRQEHGISSSS